MNIQSNISLIEQISAELRDMLGEEFDAETFWDTLDGETDVVDLIDHILVERANDKAHADAARTISQDIAKRAKRLADRDAAHKRALMRLLDATGEAKIERPTATVSRIKGRVSVSISDRASVPTQLLKPGEPDKAAIKAQLDAGEEVPGAMLVRGDDTISIRVV